MQQKRQEAKAAEKRMVKNILSVYEEADYAARDYGLHWYRIEGEKLEDWGKVSGVEFPNACGAAAAISPGMRWDLIEYHLTMLWRHGPTHKVPTYSKEFVRRAWRILNGEKPEAVLSGPKVTAFYNLLVTKGGSDDVVIDGHAWNIANNMRVTFRAAEDYQTPLAARVTLSRYRQAANAYRTAAELLGIGPHAVQATTWVTWRKQT